VLILVFGCVVVVVVIVTDVGCVVDVGVFCCCCGVVVIVDGADVVTAAAAFSLWSVAMLLLCFACIALLMTQSVLVSSLPFTWVALHVMLASFVASVALPLVLMVLMGSVVAMSLLILLMLVMVPSLLLRVLPPLVVLLMVSVDAVGGMGDCTRCYVIDYICVTIACYVVYSIVPRIIGGAGVCIIVGHMRVVDVVTNHLCVVVMHCECLCVVVVAVMVRGYVSNGFSYS